MSIPFSASSEDRGPARAQGPSAGPRNDPSVAPPTGRGTRARRRPALLVAAAAAFLLAACVDDTPTTPPDAGPDARAAASPAGGPGEDDWFVPGRLLVRFAPGADAAGLARAHGVDLDRPLGLDIWRVRVPAGAEENLARALSRADGVLYAEKDRIRTFGVVAEPVSCDACQATGDPFTGYKWDLLNTGEIRSSTDELLAETGEEGADVNWFPAFEALGADYDGEVLVGILDSGIRADHEDLGGRVVGGYDFYHDDPDHADDHGHGTHVTGIVGALAGNETGLAGVAHFPGAEFLSVKVCGPVTWFGIPLGYGCTDSAIVEGINWAADQGAHVLNLSLGGGEHSQAQQDALAHALEKGALPVCAAGNDGTGTVSYPARNPECVAVSATNWSDGLTSYSNWGDEIELSAPGGDFADDPYSQVASTLHGSADEYGWMAGTSMAAPQVAGLAAVLYATGMADPASVRQRMHETADDLGSPGWNPEYGHGRINVGAAVDAPDVAPPPDDEDDPVVLSVATLGASEVTESGATLAGFLETLEGADAAQVHFEWRPAGSAGWNETTPGTLEGTGEFSERIEGLTADTEYEFRAVAEAEEERATGAVETFATEPEDGDDDDEPVEEDPEIDVFEVSTRTTGPWSRAEVTWAVSHEGGALESVTSELLGEGDEVLDSQTSSVAGEEASGEHGLRTRTGNPVAVRLTVTADGRTATEIRDLD